MPRSLTGLQPSGQLHLGNYLGSIRPALALQQDYSAYYFVADFHALTTAKDPEVLRACTLEIAATFLACGLDTSKHLLFRQSDVPQVTELAWILACNTGMGVLDRGHAVKAARDNGKDPNAGTLFYPVLMSADILLYDANVVPVGADQKQHVEIARDMAQSFNHHYGEGGLVVPELKVQQAVGIVPGLDGRKMSKSYGNTIPIWDPPKKLRKRVMKVVTDSRGVDDVKDPSTCNVFHLFKLFATEEEQAELAASYANPPFGYGHAKQALFEVIDRELGEARERYLELRAHPERIEEVLDGCAVRARADAEATMERVRARVGLR